MRQEASLTEQRRKVGVQHRRVRVLEELEQRAKRSGCMAWVWKRILSLRNCFSPAMSRASTRKPRPTERRAKHVITNIPTAETLSPIRKAAIFLVTLGEEASAESAAPFVRG